MKRTVRELDELDGLLVSFAVFWVLVITGLAIPSSIATLVLWIFAIVPLLVGYLFATTYWSSNYNNHKFWRDV